MAFMTCQIYSHALYSNISFNISIPTPTSGDKVNYATLARDFGYEEGLPVAFLLHGMYGDANSWLRFSNVDRYAQDRRIAIVTCSAGNSFYQNMAKGQAWETFFTKELPAYVRTLFPISSRREDTFIGGFSMGGYGAWHLGLAAPEVFSKTASMSGALDIVSLLKDRNNVPSPAAFHWDAIFDDPDKVEGSGSDLLAQFRKCKEAGCVPEMYQACGTEDFLYQMNLSVRDRLRAQGCDLTWNEGPGAHDWNFWDREIGNVLNWFLKDRQKAEKHEIMG